MLEYDVPKKSPFPALASELDDSTWAFPEVGRLRLRIATSTLLRAIDESWGRSRPPGGSSVGWRWYDLGAAAEERFVVTLRDEPIAVWTGKARVTFAKRDYYRLDRLEVHPAFVGQGVGVASILLVARRSVEVGADGVLLASVPDASAFYERLGASRGAPKGWHYPRDLVPFRFDSSTIEELAADADAFRE